VGSKRGEIKRVFGVGFGEFRLTGEKPGVEKRATCAFCGDDSVVPKCNQYETCGGARRMARAPLNAERISDQPIVSITRQDPATLRESHRQSAGQTASVFISLINFISPLHSSP